jgi:hypothetical protein
LSKHLESFNNHRCTLEAPALPVAAAFGFMPGLIFGLGKGYQKATMTISDIRGMIRINY